jgi:hypothetical protein
MTKNSLLLLLIISFNINHAQNNYLDFDGTNDFVNVVNSDNILANSNNITLSCKVYPRRSTTGFPDFNGFMGYRNESNFDFYLIQLSSTDVEARFRNSNGEAFTITYTGLVLNQWTQFFLVYNSVDETLRLYNGTTPVGVVNASGSVPANSTGTLKIGLNIYQSFNWYHNGKIDEASLWNKALTPAEISTIVNNGGEIQNPLSQPNLKLYYKFNQGIPYGNNASVTNVTDELGLNTGTIQNFALAGNSSNWGSDTLGTTQFHANQLAVYPNPASDFIFISGLTDDLNVKIVDISGRIVSNTFLSDENSKINVSHLHSGVYFIVTDSNLKMKFIKM